MPVKAKDKEMLPDVAVLNSGSYEGVIELAILNNVSITKDLKSGDSLITGAVIDADAVNELKSMGARPASAIVSGDGVQQEGISIWAIKNDFVVTPNP